MNNTINNEYQKLLAIGRKRIQKTENNDLEEHAQLDKLRPLNDYVYTYYSTNEGDNTYSIEFIVLSQYLKPLLKKLAQKKLWFLAKNYASDEDIIEDYDKQKNDETKPTSMVIAASDLSRFNLKNDQNPSGWTVDSKDGSKITLKREEKIHFLESDNVADIKNEYSKNYFLNMSFISELAGEIDIDLLSKNVAVVMIEDPVVNQKTLYQVLHEICEQTIKFPQISACGKLRKSRKSKSKSKSKSGKSKSPISRKSRKNTASSL